MTSDPNPCIGNVDGESATVPTPDGIAPFVALDYDGAPLASPAVDFNYEITTYQLTLVTGP